MSAAKRIKRDTSPSPSPSEHDLEQEHCTICLQSFLDRTIVPVCAHEFCFECILVWSEQSRKCPLCSRSFDDSYLIHRIRSQYDYQKHYLPPLRTSPLPLAGASLSALRNTRRERQWGRRQRQQREEADQLERAIARRRWIYQHHLYAKHVASNPYTRYRPFPTPAQFAASPDLISRMTTFLRRELRVWPNLDVEFLTTYTISLMKSIDIRSESAVKLLSEFLDLDTPYTAGARHVHAEHFAHEIYSYLRSPYRDLYMYDQSAQYDTPPEISPPHDMERGSRWSAEPSPSRRSRSRSNSSRPSPVPRRENSVLHSHTGRDSSAEARRTDKPHHRHEPNRSPRRIPHGQEDPRNHLSGTRHSPPDGVQGILRNGPPGGTSFPKTLSSAVLAQDQNNTFPVRPRSRGDEKGRGQATNAIVPATDRLNPSAPQGDDDNATTAPEAIVLRRVDQDRPLEGTGADEAAHGVESVGSGSSANPLPPRNRLAAHVHPRNRTLSASVQAHLSRPAAPRLGCLPKKAPVSGGKQPPGTRSGTGTAGRSTMSGVRPGALVRLTDRPDAGVGRPDTMRSLPSPCGTTTITGTRTVGGDPSVRDDAGFEPCHDRRFRSCVLSVDGAAELGGAALTAATAVENGDKDEDVRRASASTEVDVSVTAMVLETRLRARARVRARLAAIKGVGGAVRSGSGSVLGSGPG